MKLPAKQRKGNNNMKKKLVWALLAALAVTLSAGCARMASVDERIENMESAGQMAPNTADDAETENQLDEDRFIMSLDDIENNTGGPGKDTGEDIVIEYNDQEIQDGYVDYTVALLRESVTEKENSMISPLSVMMALNMASSGSEGRTRTQLNNLICPGITQQQLETYCVDLLDRYNSGEDVQLHIANSVWINDQYTEDIKPDYIERADQIFNALVTSIPFDPDAAGVINDWVDENTDGMITKLFDNVDSNVIMYLVNAIAVEAPWAKPYEDSQVKDGTFTNAAGRKENVDMMYSTETYYFESGDAVGFLKPYEGYEYGFLAILPDADVTVEEYLQNMTGDSYREFYNSVSRDYDVYTAMPKFSFDYTVTLNDALQNLGVVDAFDPEAADFTGIAELDNRNLFINMVLHKTYIEVGQYETRAAAVTGVAVATASMPIPRDIKEVYLDRPFIYAIVEIESGTPIFIGTLQSAD